MKIASTLLAVALFGAIFGARAENATVEAVQYPAWLDRGGNTVPLTPGTPLQADDKLRTGGNARVQVKMGEGSTVKLGENAQFVVERIENRGVFRAALGVLTGAFRFTTNALRKSQQRDISIKVRGVTAG
ncbi:MAG TPA: FecR domain-containing protein, partial [Usitatibacter sp.]